MAPSPSLIRQYDQLAPTREETETATFALGCFWGPDAQFGAVDGVARTRVGYAGGTTQDPTYHALGDQSETFQVDYDPEVISYGDLLDVAFRSHNPNQQTRTTQYQNVVFAATEAQRSAIDSYLAVNGLDAAAIETRIEQLSRFYPAEDYHQKHSLRAKRALMEAFDAAGYDDEALRESPAGAKLNAEAAGRDVSARSDLDLLEDPTSQQ